MEALDLYCGIGGASQGLSDAGFNVTGIDLDPKVEKYYPHKFINMSVLDVDPSFLENFDIVFASPPCQAHSDLKARTGLEYADLIPETRELLKASGVPYVIENVESVNEHLINPVMLCGTMFGLGAHCKDGQYRQLQRHRLFETSFGFKTLLECKHEGQPVGCYGNGGGGQQTRGYKAYSTEGIEAMGLRHYAPRKYVNQAIPGAYTEHIAGYWREINGS